MCMATQDPKPDPVRDHSRHHSYADFNQSDVKSHERTADDHDSQLQLDQVYSILTTPTGTDNQSDVDKQQSTHSVSPSPFAVATFQSDVNTTNHDDDKSLYTVHKYETSCTQHIISCIQNLNLLTMTMLKSQKFLRWKLIE